LLGLAEAVVVTEDSVNMLSEAATSGLPLHIFRLSRTSPKIAAFCADLIARGAARPFEGRIQQWRYTPLGEADRIAAEVVARGLISTVSDLGEGGREV
jgi:mitochondrial fission protein ELM1